MPLPLNELHSSSISKESVATQTNFALLFTAASNTLLMIVFPDNSARGFPGNLLELYLAGMRTLKLTYIYSSIFRASSGSITGIPSLMG